MSPDMSLSGSDQYLRCKEREILIFKALLITATNYRPKAVLMYTLLQ